eukprot:1569518-Pleurochrysis_carterae.AAC.1
MARQCAARERGSGVADERRLSLSGSRHMCGRTRRWGACACGAGETPSLLEKEGCGLVGSALVTEARG